MFPDFPFDDHLPSFLHHTSVQQYLEKYSEKHDIAHHIKVCVCLNSKFCVYNEKELKIKHYFTSLHQWILLSEWVPSD